MHESDVDRAGDEAIVEHPEGGSRLQLAQKTDGPIDTGNAFWKLYVNTNDIEDTFDRVADGGTCGVRSPSEWSGGP